MPPCNQCSEEFDSSRQLSHHTSEYHSLIPDFVVNGVVYSVTRSGDDNTLACPIPDCSRKYSTRTAFKRHIDNDHCSQPSSTPPTVIARPPSPPNVGAKRALSESVESLTNGRKKLKGLMGKVTNAIQSESSTLYG